MLAAVKAQELQLSLKRKVWFAGKRNYVKEDGHTGSSQKGFQRQLKRSLTALA
jgi:hypothetical protein